MKTINVLMLCALLLPAGLASAADDDVYNDEALRNLKFTPPPGSEWKEQDLVLPPYPREDNLVEIEVGRADFPYKLFIDTGSVSIGQDDIVRYTAILRSKGGVDNVSFEGILCNRYQYRRYAYGAAGQFHPVPNSDWRRIKSQRQDIYRTLLAKYYFCPLPTGDRLPQLIARLKDRGAAGHLLPGDEY